MPPAYPVNKYYYLLVPDFRLLTSAVPDVSTLQCYMNVAAIGVRTEHARLQVPTNVTRVRARYMEARAKTHAITDFESCRAPNQANLTLGLHLGVSI